MNCQECNGKVDDTDNFCRYCGNSLMMFDDEQSEPQELVLNQFALNIMNNINNLKEGKFWTKQ